MGYFYPPPIIPCSLMREDGDSRFFYLFFFFFFFRGDRRKENHLLGKSNLITIDVTHMQRHTHKGMESHQCICTNAQRNSINASAHSCNYSPFYVYVQVRNYTHHCIYGVNVCLYWYPSVITLYSYIHTHTQTFMYVFASMRVCLWSRRAELALSLLLSVTEANHRLNRASGDMSLILYIENGTHTHECKLP